MLCVFLSNLTIMINTTGNSQLFEAHVYQTLRNKEDSSQCYTFCVTFKLQNI